MHVGMKSMKSLPIKILTSARVAMATNCKVHVLSRRSVTCDLKCDKGPSFGNVWITLAKGTEVSWSQFHELPSLTKKKATFGVREHIIKACSLTLMA
jgi:hypothetical protein